MTYQTVGRSITEKLKGFGKDRSIMIGRYPPG